MFSVLCKGITPPSYSLRLVHSSRQAHVINMRIGMAVLLVALGCNLARGQATPPAIILIDVENLIQYQSDISDPLKLATNPNITPPGRLNPNPNPINPGARNFYVVDLIGDIVAVNGQPAKGAFAGRTRVMRLNPDPNPANPGGPGAAIADVSRLAIREQLFEILKSDGTPIGTIMGFGLSGGSPPPGAPFTQTADNFAIVGGTGAFLGARGQFGTAASTTKAPRMASMEEDPSNRRINGGGGQRFVLHLIPMSAPQVAVTSAGPAVTHSSDFTLVTASKPAAASEVLSLFATGLGPTVPGVDPGQAFPARPPAAVNSPVEVKVNGVSAEVLGAVGFPGAVDGYQVNFRVPPGTAKGIATIQISAAWIASAPVSVMVQ